MTTTKSPRQIFVNLPVRDLERSMEFFSKLGFEFNRQFTDEKCACMVISETSFVMLLVDTFFKTFTEREIADGTMKTEAILALSCASKAEVDGLAERALAGGGKEVMPPKDHGFMYYRTFYDLDGHHWEMLWMDSKHAEK